MLVIPQKVISLQSFFAKGPKKSEQWCGSSAG